MKKYIALIMVLSGISILGHSQNIEPNCFRLEGVQLPCLSGGVSPIPGGGGNSCAGGSIEPDKAACDLKECPVPVIIRDTVRDYQRGDCLEYSYQCVGSRQFDGCSISCSLQGNSCVNVKEGNCGGLSVTCTKERGSCLRQEQTCTNKAADCYKETELQSGKANFNEETGCCKCPFVSVKRCGTC